VWNGGLSQTVTIGGNTAAGPQMLFGVSVGGTVRDGGSIGQNLTISGNQIGAARYAGITLFASAGLAGGTFSQAGTISGNSVAGATGVDGDGLRAVTSISDSAAATVSQTFTVLNNTFSNNSFNGVYVFASAAGTNGKISGAWTLAGNVINANGDDGVRVFGDSSPVTENVVLSSGGVTNTIAGNAVGAYGTQFGGAVVNITLGGTNLGGNALATAGNATFSP
jgi:parallel beta-helix repeat protein